MLKRFNVSMIAILCVVGMSLFGCGPSESEKRLQRQRERILPTDGPATHPSEWNKDLDDNKLP